MTEDKYAKVLERIGARLDAIDAKLEQLTAKKPKKHAGPNGFDIGPVVISMPIIGGTYEVRQALVTELETLYPAVDIGQTLNEIKGWLIGNKTRLKTHDGMVRCITTWCSKEQNRG